MKIINLTVLSFILCIPSHNSQACFFKSDCPDGYECVTEKNAVRGSCQPDKKAQDLNQKPKEDIKCSWNMDCPVGNHCVKSTGAAQGICWEDKTSEEKKNISQFKECTFNSDCNSGSICQRPRGSLHGLCREVVFNNVDNTTPSILVPKEKVEDKTPHKQCLLDVDCGLNYTCVMNGKSVYGNCQSKAGTVPGTTIP